MIHFAHGNGFPSKCYQQFFDEFNGQFKIFFIDKIGHDEDYPVSENWSFLVDEVINSITSQCNQKVIGIGHSLGGVLTLLASYKRPELFKKVILLDAPAYGYTKSNLIKIIKKLDLMHFVTPLKSTQRRIISWASKASLKDYLLSKSVYQKFSPQSLDNYIEHGMTRSNNGGYQLKFDRQIESKIYKTFPHDMYINKTKLHIPVHLIYGLNSNIITKHDLRVMQKKYFVSTQVCSGGHLFPFEFPRQAAKLVLNLIK